MSKPNNELKNIVEAAILVADDPLSIRQILSLFPGNAKPGKNEIRAAIDLLTDECEERGIELKKVGNGFRYQSKKQYADWLRKLYEQKPPRYSRAVLETLSIIAYNQPVTRGDIEDIRGVSVSTDIMRTLLARSWVKEVGFKAVPGRPALYATTKEFLDYFNLKSLRELPTLQQRRELEEVAKDNQIQLPIEPELLQTSPADTNADQQLDIQPDQTESTNPDSDSKSKEFKEAAL